MGSLLSEPLIQCGYINYSVKDEQNREKLTILMKDEFSLDLVSKAEESTTRKQTCIDLTFPKNVPQIDCVINESYFSHRSDGDGRCLV